MATDPDGAICDECGGWIAGEEAGACVCDEARAQLDAKMQEIRAVPDPAFHWSAHQSRAFFAGRVDSLAEEACRLERELEGRNES